MKQLLKKEFTLTASAVTYFFIAFGLMAFIPGYPILVSAFFVCLGIQMTFQFAREHNDILYTVLLPVNKGDAVKARYLFCAVIEMISFAVSAIVTVIRMTVLCNAEVYVKNVLLSANLTFLAFVLLIYTLFNTIFIGGFFKTAYYYGKGFVIFSILSFLTVGIAETLHHIPILNFLNSTGGRDLIVQAAILLVSVVIYVSATLLSMKRSVRNFETIDL